MKYPERKYRGQASGVKIANRKEVGVEGPVNPA